MTTVLPTPQRLMKASVVNARLGSVSQAGPSQDLPNSSPRSAIAVLMKPSLLLSRHIQTIADATSGTSDGRKMIVRYAVLPPMLLFNITASPSDTIIAAGRATSAYLNVVTSVIQKTGSAKSAR